MHEFAIYSVIPPEGCAAILWRDSNRKVEAATALKLTAPDLLRVGIIDEIVPEPIGGAHTNHDWAATLLDTALERALAAGVGDGFDARAWTRGIASGARWAMSGSRRREQEGLRNQALGSALTMAKASGRGCRSVNDASGNCGRANARMERWRESLAISPVTARLLCIRGLADADQARRFLSPALDDLHDPFALADMAPAVDRILGAIARKERIAIHGDYDVDGVTSTVILRRALELLGADVTHFIPERLRDGYGLQPAALDRLHADGARLVISVDCGIRGVEAALHARSLGLDLIITDHHEPDTYLPAGFRRDQPQAARLRVPRQEPGGRWRGAEGRAGAVLRRRAERRGCRPSSRSRPSARLPTSCR